MSQINKNSTPWYNRLYWFNLGNMNRGLSAKTERGRMWTAIMGTALSVILSIEWLAVGAAVVWLGSALSTEGMGSVFAIVGVVVSAMMGLAFAVGSVRWEWVARREVTPA